MEFINILILKSININLCTSSIRKKDLKLQFLGNISIKSNYSQFLLNGVTILQILKIFFNKFFLQKLMNVSIIAMDKKRGFFFEVIM